MGKPEETPLFEQDEGGDGLSADIVMEAVVEGNEQEQPVQFDEPVVEGDADTIVEVTACEECDIDVSRNVEENDAATEGYENEVFEEPSAEVLQQTSNGLDEPENIVPADIIDDPNEIEKNGYDTSHFDADLDPLGEKITGYDESTFTIAENAPFSPHSRSGRALPAPLSERNQKILEQAGPRKPVPPMPQEMMKSRLMTRVLRQKLLEQQQDVEHWRGKERDRRVYVHRQRKMILNKEQMSEDKRQEAVRLRNELVQKEIQINHLKGDLFHMEHHVISDLHNQILQLQDRIKQLQKGIMEGEEQQKAVSLVKRASLCAEDMLGTVVNGAIVAVETLDDVLDLVAEEIEQKEMSDKARSEGDGTGEDPGGSEASSANVQGPLGAIVRDLTKLLGIPEDRIDTATSLVSKLFTKDANHSMMLGAILQEVAEEDGLNLNPGFEENSEGP